ncbi:MAG: prepilin-type N-terminal cleavage/methylation domain-containing protein [Clostridiales bacterium]|nr:prepilin-type N-terminal cleavage/methylation domain-containing protein [Clostridiales bacterium]
MKNLLKNKKGFSLAEILLVVAIIVILSGATMIGIASMVNRSQAAASRAVANNANFEADAVLKVNKKKGMVNNEPFETETLNTGATENNQPTQTEAPTPTETKKEDPKPTKPSDTKPSDTKPSDTSKPTETTKAQGGGQQGGGGAITVTAPSLTTAGSGTAGPISYSVNGDSVTIKLNAGNNNSNDVTDIVIKKQADGSYLIDLSGVDNGKYWICQNCKVDNGNDFWNGKKTKVVSAQDIESALKIKLS